MTECEYCHAIIAFKKNLKAHQETVQHCLKIQGKIEEAKKLSEINKCPGCNSCYSTKSNLKQHMKNCNINVNNNSTAINIGNNSNIINSNIINSNLNLHFHGFTFNDLTPEYIENTLRPVITRAIVESGLSKITEVIVDKLLQPDGKPIYCCSDRSRKVLKMLTTDDTGQIVEPIRVLIKCVKSYTHH